MMAFVVYFWLFCIVFLNFFLPFFSFSFWVLWSWPAFVDCFTKLGNVLQYLATLVPCVKFLSTLLNGFFNIFLFNIFFDIFNLLNSIFSPFYSWHFTFLPFSLCLFIFLSIIYCWVFFLSIVIVSFFFLFCSYLLSL